MVVPAKGNRLSIPYMVSNMRITGFIVIPTIIIAAIAAVLITTMRSSIPEPHASCIQAWRGVPNSPLAIFGGADLAIEESRSRVVTDDEAGMRIITRVGPVARAAGQPVTIECRQDAEAADDADASGIRPILN